MVEQRSTHWLKTANGGRFQSSGGRSELAAVSSTNSWRDTSNLEARPWCIAQAGFTPEALAFAAENGVLVSSGEDVAALAKLIR